MTVSEEVKKFQEAGLELAQRQAGDAKPPLKPSDLAEKLVQVQKKTGTTDNH